MSSHQSDDGEAGAAPARTHAAERASESSRVGEPYIVVQVLSPDGVKTPLKVKASDDVSTLRALITQMFDSSEWTQVSDRREDRHDYSDWTDEDTGFSEVIALEGKNPQQPGAPRFDWRRPRTWLEWTDRRGKLRLMCGAYFLEDGKDLQHYHIQYGSSIHPLYERYGDTLDASARMLVDPDWYMEQAQQAKSLATEASTWDWTSTAAKARQYFVWPGPLVDHTPKPPKANEEQRGL
mmetsp:Transcript_38229/g.93939  ORF Transcript_38229/g.93939 Transcript_38229/m.93939 type:complete len:237 (+) Transcript_38229:157-867(+)